MSFVGVNILKASELLKNGGVIAIPTETVYGIAANAYDENAVEKIYNIKKRPYNKPLIVHASSLDMVNEFVADLPDLAIKLAANFWPGPLTILLPKNNKIPDIVTSSLPLVGVRVPNNEITLKLLNNINFPIAAPSANLFNYISPTNTTHIINSIGNKIDYILEGGKCSIGIESTIVGFKNDEIIIYRLGGISPEDIMAVCNGIKVSINTNNNKLPGSSLKHYSPKTTMVLTDNLKSMLHLHKDKKIGALSFNDSLVDYNIYANRVLTMSGDLNEAAANLYNYLIELDGLELELILASYVPNIGIGLAINDRLKRAASN